ncbi:MAG: serine hydrolase domain-containing protein [Alphaproteobacteria bacterium]
MFKTRHLLAFGLAASFAGLAGLAGLAGPAWAEADPAAAQSCADRPFDLEPISEGFEALGWSPDGLARLRQTADDLGSLSLIIRTGDKTVFTHGRIDARQTLHSVRKSLVSVLMGLALEQDAVRLSDTLADLGIDDLTPLSDVERGATVMQLMASRSGITLPAAAQGTPDRRPARGTLKPGERWVYNNFDFNVVDAIYRQTMGEPIFEAFATRIAAPLCMEDYRPQDGRTQYLTSWGRKVSRFPVNHFRMSARDLARFATLVLDDGRWGARQVVPETWIRESTRPLSQTGEPLLDAYGLMWWVVSPNAAEDAREQLDLTTVFPPGSFAAAGFGGQFVMVAPAWDTVIVHQVRTGGLFQRTGFGAKKRIRLISTILRARVP